MQKIFIGYDDKEAVSFHTLSHSIMRHASKPVAIIPLNLANLGSVYKRPHDPRQSNSFSFSRFLVPYLCNYQGSAIFMDCDMLVTSDICDLFDHLSCSEKPVHVVKHDYKSKVDVKYLGNKQYHYPKKNWSSFVFWNCEAEQNKCVTPKLVNESEPAYLHRFQWLDDSEIGEIEIKWNFLVGEYERMEATPNNIHWTLGGPYFNDYRDADYADLWHKEFELMTHCEQIE